MILNDPRCMIPDACTLARAHYSQWQHFAENRRRAGKQRRDCADLSRVQPGAKGRETKSRTNLPHRVRFFCANIRCDNAITRVATWCRHLVQIGSSVPHRWPAQWPPRLLMACGQPRNAACKLTTEPNNSRCYILGGPLDDYVVHTCLVACG